MSYSSLDELSDAILKEIKSINIILGDIDIYNLGEIIWGSTMKNISYIEDPEYRIYYKYYSKICENIINRTKCVSSTLIMTQSLEFIDSLLEVANKLNILDNISVFTIRMNENENQNKEYFYRKILGTKALQLREDYCMELRY